MSIDVEARRAWIDGFTAAVQQMANWNEESARMEAERQYARLVPAEDEGRLREAAAATVAAWDRYVEAHAGRGHDGEHEPERALNGDCGPCAGAQYGTEIEIGEYVIPALKAALAATPEPTKPIDLGYTKVGGLPE